MSTWTLSTPTDLIPTVVGGNRYGWVSANEFDVLAIDNSNLTVVPEPASLVLLGIASAALFTMRRRQHA